MSKDDLPTFNTIKLDRRGRILMFILNRPSRLNAANSEMHQELSVALRWCGADDESDVMIVTGAGRGFCAGGDVFGMANSPTGTNVIRKPGEVHSDPRRTIDSILGIEKPIIAMVNGPAIGMGASLALFCDVVTMAEEAVIGDRHVNVGTAAGDGGAVIWPMLVGVNRAKEWLMTGRTLSGREAADAGLVNHAMPLAELEPFTMALASELGGMPKFAIRTTKAIINRQLRDQVERTLDYSLALEWLSMATEEHKEAVQRFTDGGLDRRGTSA